MAADILAPGFAPLLEVRGLSKQYVQRSPLNRRRFTVSALEDLNLAIPAGTTLAVVGESGSGKSTLARCVALLETPQDPLHALDEIVWDFVPGAGRGRGHRGAPSRCGVPA